MSMNLITNLLKNGFEQSGHIAVVWSPTVFLGVLAKNTFSGLGKWLAYFDKWVVFPLVITLRLLLPSNRKSNVRFHIADHSNVIYLRYLPNAKTIVSCHDVLAIRGALGHKDAYCEASSFGVILQSWILKGLLKAKKLATVSQTTLNLLNELDLKKNPNNNDRRLILNAFNEDFVPMPKKDAIELLNKAHIPADLPFILHIGSSLPRKNRKVIIEMMNLIQSQWNGMLIFAGQELEDDLTQLVVSFGLENRVISVVRPNYQILNALYSACEAFIFPSFSEGFGWPIIEAQACGAPVIASNIEPIPEVSGGAALLCNPYSPQEFADAFISLSFNNTKSDLVQKGFVNCNRFNPQRMIEEYISFHLENTNEKTT
ncbi:MAG: glycosyltransferase family 4 protein [Bacteroidia bacterium]|nr:glycosyltransferase family 4 protein [Bacteroidia bacterium]